MFVIGQSWILTTLAAVLLHGDDVKNGSCQTRSEAKRARSKTGDFVMCAKALAQTRHRGDPWHRVGLLPGAGR